MVAVILQYQNATIKREFVGSKEAEGGENLVERFWGSCVRWADSIRPLGHEEGEIVAAVGLVGGSRNLEGKEGAVNSWVAAVIVVVGLFMLGFAVVGVLFTER
ncbi:hypothetical protein ACLOJK_037545 [Asimina triloba]